jgi:hypothetical protein
MLPILLFRPNDGSHLRKAFKWTSDLQDLQADERPTDASEMAKRWFKSHGVRVEPGKQKPEAVPRKCSAEKGRLTEHSENRSQKQTR